MDDIVLSPEQCQSYERWKDGLEEEDEICYTCSENDTSIYAVMLKFFIKLFVETKGEIEGEMFRFYLVDDGSPHFVMSNHGRLFHVLTEKSLARGNHSKKKVALQIHRRNGEYSLYIGKNQPLDKKKNAHQGIYYSQKLGSWRKKQCHYVNVSFYTIMTTLWTQEDLESSSIAEIDKRKILEGAARVTPNKWAGIVLKDGETGEVYTFESKVSAAEFFGVNQSTFRSKVFTAKPDEEKGLKKMRLKKKTYYIVDNDKPNWMKEKDVHLLELD